MVPSFIYSFASPALQKKPAYELVLSQSIRLWFTLLIEVYAYCEYLAKLNEKFEFLDLYVLNHWFSSDEDI